MATMCVADFLTTEVWTFKGLVRYYTLFVMNLAKRQVQIAQISFVDSKHHRKSSHRWFPQQGMRAHG